MTTIELSFHEAIRLGDIEARLIYADWLEDHGRYPEAAMLHSGRWCLIPAGSFWMGDGDGKPGEKQVTIQNHFYLGAYLVTQAEWQTVMGTNPSCFSRTGGLEKRVSSISDDDLKLFPVEMVSWEDVQSFIQRLNDRNHDPGWVYRLPTEEEWEYACRGGVSSKEECSYDFYLDKPSNELSPAQANFNLGCTTKVGSYLPNRLGLYDMHGNVWEWTDTLNGSGRVIRGGSWGSYGQYCRADDSYEFTPSDRSHDLGFRLARVPCHR